MSPPRERSPSFVGAAYALAAFLFWGGVPIYFKWTADVPPLEVLAHRIAWSVVMMAGVLTLMGRWRVVGAHLRAPRVMGMLLLSALTVSVNWLIFIWAVAQGHVLETSLGYFINPLVNVLFGTLFLRERLRLAGWVAVGLAALGVTFQVVQLGQVPVVALVLAFSFGTYGLIRKVVPVDGYSGLYLETLLLSPLALGYLVYLGVTGADSFGGHGWEMDIKLILAGAITAIPLVLFAEGARRLRYSTIGFFQYIAPTMSFFLAIWLWHEPFNGVKGVAFGCIWVALAIYTADSVMARRQGSGAS